MDTIKTAFVVALLLAVLYGVYVVLNKEQPAPPPEVASIIENDEELAAPDIDLGTFEPSPPSAPTSGAPSVDYPHVSAPAAPGVGSLPELPAAPSQYATAQPPRTDLTSQPPTAMPSSVPTDPLALRNAPRDLSNDPVGSSGSANVYADSNPAGSTASTQPVSRWGGNTVPSTPSAPTTPSTQLGPPITEPPYDAVPTSPYGSTTAVDSSRYATPDVTTPGASPEASASVQVLPIAEAMTQAQELAAAEKYHEALRVLSLAYQADNVSESDRRMAHELLDPLAGRVIYSREHLLLPEHVVAAGETLDQVADKYRVPVKLLQNINGVSDPTALVPGTPLKVVEGPFRAEVDTVNGELTMYVRELYAGRFPIQAGADPQPIPGDYMVLTKQEGRTYYGQDGAPVPSHDPRNPYGTVWMDLGAGNLCIHGTASAPTSGPQGCLSLGPRDAEDVYGILSVGSRVTIRR